MSSKSDDVRDLEIHMPHLDASPMKSGIVSRGYLVNNQPLLNGTKMNGVQKNEIDHLTDRFNHHASTSENGLEPNTKRTDCLSWDDYFMAIALLSAQRSKDPKTQVGACIVDEQNRIVGMGYNGMPRGCSDDALPWGRTGQTPLDTKYLYVVHAEMNAILNTNKSDLTGCRIYVALFPCNECAKLIIQAGIKTVIYMSDKYHDNDHFIASRRLLDLAGVETRQHKPETQTITIDFSESHLN